MRRRTAGAQGRFSRALDFARGALAIWPAMMALARRDMAGSAVHLAQLRTRNRQDGAIVRGASSAALRGARAAESRSLWLAAARFWVAYEQLTGDTPKAVLNMIRGARMSTARRSDSKTVARALEIWKLASAVDPGSIEAGQGIAWCNARLSETTGKPAARSKRDSGAPLTDIRALYEGLKRDTPEDAASQCVAGRLLLRAGAPALALEFIEQAAQRQMTSETTQLLFNCLAALDRNSEAARLLEPLAANRGLSDIAAQQIVSVLERTPPNFLSGDILRALAQSAAARRLAPTLLPLVLAADERDAVLSLARVAAAKAAWPESLVLQTAEYLWDAGERTDALRLLALFAHAEPVASAFSERAAVLEPDKLERLLLGGSPPEGELRNLCLALAEHHLRLGEADWAVLAFGRAVNAAALAQTIRTEEGERFATLVAGLASESLCNANARGAIARLVVSLAPEHVRAFYSSPAFVELRASLAAGSAFNNAPDDSRTGILRENYFDYHMERRENRSPEDFASPLALCDAAMSYFEAILRVRQIEQIPVSSTLRERLAAPCLAYGDGRSAGALLSYAVWRDRPDWDLKSEAEFERAAEWLVNEFMPGHNIPSSLLGPDVLGEFNRAVYVHSQFGVVVTNFAQSLWSRSDVFKSRYRLDNALDALLFCLDLAATLPASALQYRGLISAMLPPSKRLKPTLVDECVEALSVSSGMRAQREPFTQLLAYSVPVPAASILPALCEQPQDILLIGHGGEGTGLSRNVRMLRDALEGEDIKLTTLSYELDPASFAAAAKEWRKSCRGPPIVVAAVNAQDIPTIFVNDRHDALASAYVAGFFLWETSRAPRVQQLGIRLVNEIWAPTRYVANVYAALAPVHVVGKGLFSAQDWPQPSVRNDRGMRRFLTVFDFHSSIERKNPLAAVLAFRRAFPGDEPVELIVKASNVNPQHPGNASGQWERLGAASEGDNRICIVTSRYTEQQMRDLMGQASCVVSLHRSEGFGYILSDAMALGIPVIATAYSGNADFCDEATSFPVSYRLVPVNSHGAHWESEETEWADPDIDSAATQMRRVFEDYASALQKAAWGRQDLMERYSAEAFRAALRQRIATIRQGGGVDPASVRVQ